ncbi:MAG: YncE family protein [Chthoniobacterales bacterium]
MKTQDGRQRSLLRWVLPLAAAGCLAAVTNSVHAQPTNTILKTVEVPLPSGVVVTPDNKYVYVVSNNYDALYRIDISTQTVESNTIALGGNAQFLAIAPKGGEVLVANPVDGYNGGIWGVPGTVSVITGAQSTTPSLKQVIAGMGVYANCVGINPTGTQAWVGNQFEGDCSVINLLKNTVSPYPIQTGDGPVCIKFTADGKNAYVVNYYDNTVDEINVATQLIVGNPVPVAEYPTHIAITPDGTKAYVSGFSGSVSVIDTATNTVTTTIAITTSEYGNYWFGSAMTPDGLYLYVPNQNAQTVVMISTATDTIVGSPITLGQTPGTIAISPNGKFAYINQMYNWTVAIVKITGG